MKRSALTVCTLVSAAALAACSGGSTESGSQSSHSGASATSSSSRAAVPGHTSCTQVRYFGDSVSVGLVTPQQIPDAAERLQARLGAVGVTSTSVDVSGGRSVVERLGTRPNVIDAMPDSSTYKGCYVMAIGTNDAANVNVGSNVSLSARIDTVMKRAHGRPVLWPTVAAQPVAPHGYDQAAMQRFDAALVDATKRYPNLRVYDWAAERNPAWTEGDGIHDRRIGSRSRALMYAKALAVAFPEGAPMNASKVIGSVAGKAASTANQVKLPARDGDRGSFWAGDVAALTHYVSGPPMK